MSAAPESTSRPAPRIALEEVRYSLPEMLEELQAERATSTFAMEKLDQHEIGKLFKAKPAARAKNKK